MAWWAWLGVGVLAGSLAGAAIAYLAVMIWFASGWMKMW
jgi:hypothetical protein